MENAAMKALIGTQLLRVLSRAEGRSLTSGLRHALGSRSLALCFHRVAAERRASELQPKLTMPAAEIDALISAVLEACTGRLTVSFDDGYRDSADYILSRAARYPQVEWIFFVCPQKTEQRAGFRWDLAETRRRLFPGLDPEGLLSAPVDLAGENQRDELRGLLGLDGFALAELELCRTIQRLPNAALGNHTNVHHRLALLTAEQARAELVQSTRDFERLFGPQRHFAFPYGVPGVDFSPEHAAALRAMGPMEFWSTEPRPFSSDERVAGAVLPRFAVDGTRSWKETAAQIAVHALRSRVFQLDRRASG
jgi:peptidoglycan/xylan/chitin deacetylase (PgdA/CDA1 family)